MTLVRPAIALGIAVGYAAAVFTDDQPAAMALGLAPLAWLALEGCWRLLRPGQ